MGPLTHFPLTLDIYQQNNVNEDKQSKPQQSYLIVEICSTSNKWDDDIFINLSEEVKWRYMAG